MDGVGVRRGDAGGRGSDNDGLGDGLGVAGLSMSGTLPSDRGDWLSCPVRRRKVLPELEPEAESL